MVGDVVMTAVLYVAALLTIAVVAAAEVALASTSRTRLRDSLESGDPASITVDRLLTEPARFLSTLMLVKSGSYVLSGASVLHLSQAQEWVVLTTIVGLLVGWLLLVTTQIVSRAYTLRRPVQVALALGPYVSILVAFLRPLSGLLRAIGAHVRNGNEEASAESIFLSEDGLRFLLHVGEGEGVIEEEEKQMIAGIFEFGDTTAREIMVPRLDVTTISVDLSLAESLPIVLSSGHSRIPVYQDNIDNIIGLLYAKDLLRCFHEERTGIPLAQILRPAYFVPQSKMLDDLLHDMRARRVHMAVIVDEYGGTAGIVTIEDMIEEIIGDIRDEYDREEPLLQSITAHNYIFNARISLDEVSAIIDIDLSEINDNVDTLGGLIYSYLGRVPEQGESLELDRWRFTVLGVNSRRIEQVRAERLAPPSNTESDSLAAETGESEQKQRQGLLGSTA